MKYAVWMLAILSIIAITTAVIFILLWSSSSTGNIERRLDLLADEIGAIKTTVAGIVDGIGSIQTAVGETASGLDRFAKSFAGYLDGIGKIESGLSDAEQTVDAIIERLQRIKKGN